MSGAANRLNASANDLANFDSYTKDLYIGATARIYRATNGVMSLVRTSEITDAKLGKWAWLKPNGDRVVDALTYTHALEGFMRPGVPYWFRVAAVGSNGLAGTWSAPVTFTPANMTGTPSGAVNPTKALNKTGESGALAAPGSVAVTAGAIAREAVITWNAVSGAEGYVVELSYYDPADQIVAQPYLDLASHAVPILSGDLVIIDRELLTQTDAIYTPRIWAAAKPISANGMMWFDTERLKRDGNDWAYVTYSGDKPALAVGDHFLRRTAAAGQTATLQRYWHSGTDQSFYSILKAGTTYRMRISMRASAATTVTLLLSGATACGISGTTFSVGTSFATFTHDMVPTTEPAGNDAYDWRLQFTAGGTPIDLDVAFFEIEEVGAASNLLAETIPAEGAYLRDHSWIKPGPNNRSIKRLITNNAYGFKKFHDACVDNNLKPWFQIEWNAPKQDFLDLVAYLAAPNGTNAITDLREASGITQPWTTTFSNMKLEMGNEAWNPLTGFWIFPSMTDSATAQAYNNGNVAGLFWQMISSWMKESPYWATLAPNLTQHVGGWAINAFGEDAYRYYPDAKEVSIAAYNGGWDNGTALVSESGLSFGGVLADPIIVQKPRAITRVNALKALCTSLGKTYGTDIRYGIYEAGPGYQLNGLNGASVTAAQIITQEVVMKSRAAAAATVDNMLTYAQQDFKDFNFFTLGRGDYWTSHASLNDGPQEYITHALPRIIHDNIAPAKVYGAPTSSFGTKTVTLQNGSTATINQIGAYQLRNLADPSKRMIVVVNRNLDPSQLDPADPLYSATPSGSVLFTLQTTWNSAASLKAWTVGIGPYRQHNRYPVGQRRVAGGGLTSDPLCVAFNYSPTTFSVPPDVKNITINDAVGATSAGLPAGNVLILLFEGVT